MPSFAARLSSFFRSLFLMLWDVFPLPSGSVEAGSDKVVVVTGCDSGFGHMLAVKLSEKGFLVYAGCLSKAGASSLTAEAPKVRARVCDVTKVSDVNKLFLELERDCPQGLWAVVNNAGINGGYLLDCTTIEEYKRVMDVNFFGTLHVTKSLAPLLRKNPGSRLINVASMLGRAASDGVSAYCASKFAVEGFTDSIRGELAHWGVHVSLVEPGFFKTPLVDSGYEGLAKSFNNNMSSDVKQLYGPNFLKEQKEQYAKILQAAGNPQVVVDAMDHAVCSTRPRARYLLGLDAKLLFIPLTFLPVRLASAIRELLLPGPTPAASLRN